MNPVKIITDGSADLPAELTAWLDADVVPLTVTFDGAPHASSEITSPELFESVVRTGVLPFTAAPSPWAFETVFQHWVAQGYDVCYLGLGSGFSGAFANARLAAQACPEGRVWLCDSGSITSAVGLLLLKAAQLRDAGKSAEETAAALTELASRVRLQFTLKDMKYLRKGGRCTSLEYLVGQLMRAHPFLMLKNGAIEPIATPKGHINRALDELIVNFREHVQAGIDPDYLLITGSVSDESKAYLYRAAAEVFDPSHIFFVEMGAVCSCHGGPGTAGYAFLAKADQTVPSEEKQTLVPIIEAAKARLNGVLPGVILDGVRKKSEQ